MAAADLDYGAELKEDRDLEWDFADKHGLDGTLWTEEQTETHDQILADIAENRERIQEIIRRVTGDGTIEF